MQLIFILPSLPSLYNVRSIFRTADALGAKKIYLTGFTGTPKQSGVKKTALGAEKIVPWEYVKSTSDVIRRLRKSGYEIAGLEKTDDSLDISEWNPSRKTAILVGNEERGLSARILSLRDTVVHVPMFGMKESLNVSVAAGAAGYVLLQRTKSL